VVKPLNLVTEWTEYKRKFANFEQAKDFVFCMEELQRIRKWLRSIPMEGLTVGDFQLILSYLAETDAHERRCAAFKSYQKVFPNSEIITTLSQPKASG